MKVHDTNGNVLGHVTIDDRDGEVRQEGNGAVLGWTYKPVGGDRGWIAEDRGTHTVMGHGTRREALRWLWYKRQEVLKTRAAKRGGTPTILGADVRKGDRIRFGFADWAREITVGGVREAGHLRDHMGRPTIMLDVEGESYATSVNCDQAVELLHRP